MEDASARVATKWNVQTDGGVRRDVVDGAHFDGLRSRYRRNL